MKSVKRAGCVILAVLAVGLFVAAPASAFADTMAGLKFDAGDSMDPRVSSEVRSAVADAYDEVDNWSFQGFKETRGSVDPVVRDCFTKDCLRKVLEATNAPVGLSVTITGEAQIYKWTITFWNLESGDKIKSKDGSCELCGRAEVTRTFRESLKAALIGTAVPKGAQAATGTDTGGADERARADTGGNKIALRISVVPKDAKITVDGDQVGAGDVTEAVGPGEYTVGFKLEGYRGLRETVVVDETTDGPVLLRVHLSRTDPEAVEVSGPMGPVDRMGSEKRNLYGAISVGAGAVMLGTGIFLTALDGEPACEPDVPANECPEIYATGGAGLTLGVLGTAAVTTGVTLLIWESLAGKSDEANDGASPDGGEDEGPEVRFGPSLTPGGGGVLLRGRF
jgi:hypothetical protein